ncbi:hypothetical protein MICAE_1280005 [Microcystis aeruginosa PCC 9806]|uniref:Uncharacterized protein n=1 Tax=Microcystis aeruginosa PCC 9806 TaxID=1160282 RepID=I4GRF0_MICAE|nr:hypothetical protein [Microcystis aeruginosa]CCI12374.1 hypothetical protein MICAE_1280005 [Microcystis aeruginosa PCC 9806]
MSIIFDLERTNQLSLLLDKDLVDLCSPIEPYQVTKSQNLKKKSAEHRRGKEPLLKEEQFQKLKEELKELPVDGGIWTGSKVARWIEKETGREKV